MLPPHGAWIIEARNAHKCIPDWVCLISILFISYRHILKAKRERPVKVRLPCTGAVHELPDAYKVKGREGTTCWHFRCNVTFPVSYCDT